MLERDAAQVIGDGDLEAPGDRTGKTGARWDPRERTAEAGDSQTWDRLACHIAYFHGWLTGRSQHDVAGGLEQLRVQRARNEARRVAAR